MPQATALSVRTTTPTVDRTKARALARQTKGQGMPTEIWTQLISEYAVSIAAASAIISGLIFIYKKALKPMIKMAVDMYKTIGKIDKIFEEITPNGGTSIKDTINKIDYKVDIIQQIQEAESADNITANFRTDPEGNCVWVNRTYIRTIGYDLSQVLGHGWQNGIAEQDRERVVNEWYTAVKEDREFSMTFNFESPAGVLIPAKVRSYKLVNDRGEILGYYGTCDILDKK
jgi:PAS domain S-box-containing protein